MKIKNWLTGVFCVTLCFAQAVLAEAPSSPDWQVYFSPKGGCTEAIVKAIDGARSTVFVQAYSFTSKPIANALVNAYQRRVDVRVIVDDSEATKGHEAAYLSSVGVPVSIDAAHAIAHNKIGRAHV